MVYDHFRFDRHGALVGFGVDHGECDLGHAQGFALARAGEDHILHVGAAQGLGALLTQYPTHSVEDVGFTAPIRSHHNGDSGPRHGDFRAIAKAFEAEDVDLFQFQHVYSGTRGDLKRPLAELAQLWCSAARYLYCPSNTDSKERGKGGQRAQGVFLWIIGSGIQVLRELREFVLDFRELREFCPSFPQGANACGSGIFECGTDGLADHFLESAESLRTGKAGAAG